VGAGGLKWSAVSVINLYDMFFVPDVGFHDRQTLNLLPSSKGPPDFDSAGNFGARKFAVSRI
jgi:hypothetical protein